MQPGKADRLRAIFPYRVFVGTVWPACGKHRLPHWSHEPEV